MNAFPLSIRCAATALRPAAAWLIPGGEVADWLRELAQWQVPLAALSLRVLPASARDRTPAGVLVSAAPGTTPCPTSRALPYGLIAKKLYLPVEARIDPPVTDAELESCLIGDVVVMHPSIGLVGFESSDVLRVSDLIARPRRRDADWDRARPGEILNARLVSVEPIVLPTVEMFLREAGGDIGSQSPQQLPPAPGEQTDAPQAGGAGSQLAEWLERQAAQGVRWLTSMAPRTASEPTWVNRLEEWAREKLTPKVIQSEREKETQRLLRLLESNPEEGLRFALPIGSGDGSRGLAPPSNQLPPRDVNFNLNRLGGGAAADPWILPWQVQQQLMERYRALADREVRLGRHRRAAYIHAELLGDLSAAANVLMQGRHYREAAVLWRDRLNRPLDAAQCLELGGLWTEAIDLYETHGEFESAGELYLRLERPEQALAAFRRAAEKRRLADDLVAAAHLLERKVNVPLEALALLTAAWPGHKQSGRCLEEGFQLMGRLGRHADAGDWITILRRRQSTVDPSRRLVLTQSLAAVSAAYPDMEVRHQAADTARVIVGEQLTGKHAVERRLLERDLSKTERAPPTSFESAMVRAVAQFAPEDRLLGRDGRRFLARATEPAKPLPAKLRKNPLLVTSFQLPQDVEWSRVAVAGDMFYIVGYASSGPVLIRGLWNGSLDRTNWTTPLYHRWKLMLESDRQAGQSVLVGQYGGPKLPAMKVGVKGISAETPSWLPPSTVATARTPLGVTWAVARIGEYTLFGYDASGALLHSRALPIFLEDPSLNAADFPVPWAMTARGDTVLVGLHSLLVRFSPSGPIEVQDFPEPIRGLAEPPAHMPFCLAVTLENGGLFLAGSFDPHRGDRFASDLVRPVAGFTSDGWLVAASTQAGEVYDVRNRRLLLNSSFPGFDSPPLAVVPTGRLGQFAVFTADGFVRLYRIAGV